MGVSDINGSVLCRDSRLMRLVLLLLLIFRLNLAWGVWVDLSSNNAPEARTLHIAVWTGQEMIVWGGWVGNLPFFNNGGIYNPEADHWRAMSVEGVPEARSFHTAVWTGQEMNICRAY